MSELKDKLLTEISTMTITPDEAILKYNQVIQSEGKGNISPLERMTLVSLIQDKARGDIQERLATIYNRETTTPKLFKDLIDLYQKYVNFNFLTTKAQTTLRSHIIAEAKQRGHRNINFKI